MTETEQLEVWGTRVDQQLVLGLLVPWPHPTPAELEGLESGPHDLGPIPSMRSSMDSVKAGSRVEAEEVTACLCDILHSLTSSPQGSKQDPGLLQTELC